MLKYPYRSLIIVKCHKQYDLNIKNDILYWITIVTNRYIEKDKENMELNKTYQECLESDFFVKKPNPTINKLIEFEDAIGLAPEHDTCVNVPDSIIMEQLIEANRHQFNSSVTPSMIYDQEVIREFALNIEDNVNNDVKPFTKQGYNIEAEFTDNRLFIEAHRENEKIGLVDLNKDSSINDFREIYLDITKDLFRQYPQIVKHIDNNQQDILNLNQENGKMGLDPTLESAMTHFMVDKLGLSLKDFKNDYYLAFDNLAQQVMIEVNDLKYNDLHIIETSKELDEFITNISNELKQENNSKHNHKMKP